MARTKYRLYQKEKGGIWWARKRQKGLPDVYFNTETSHKGSAARRADAWLEEQIASRFGERKKPTFAVAAAEAARLHFPSLSYKSKLRYEGVFNRGIDAFGELTIDKIGSAVLTDYEHTRREDGTKPNTIGLELKILGLVWKIAEKKEWWDGKNPCHEYIKKFASDDIKARPKRNYYLTHEMERRLLEVATNLWRYRMIFAVESGLRKEEQYSLLRSNVDLHKNLIRVLADVAKNHQERYVPLTPRGREAFIRTTQMIPKSDYAFPRDDGERIAWNSQSVWRRVQQFARAAFCPHLSEDEDLPDEFNVGPHWFRKTCGCRLIQDRRFPIERVSKWLGHKSIKVTQDSYAFLEAENLQEMVQETEMRVKKIGGTPRGKDASVLLEKPWKDNDL